MNTKVKIFHWFPRILCILAILFLELFALDAFDPALTFGEQMFAFLMHSIPALVLTVILILSWKKELIGGIVFLIIGAGFSPLIYLKNYAMNDSIWMSLSIVLALCFPFILTGILFIVSRNLKRNVQFLNGNKL